MTAREGPGRGWAAGLDRPHIWLCRHCDMVDDYHLERDAQLRRKESLDRRDEIDRLVVFKDWLRTYEWESQQPDQDADPGDGDADWAADWAAEIPAQRGTPDPVDIARRAVDAVPDADDELDDGGHVEERADEPVLERAS